MQSFLPKVVYLGYTSCRMKHTLAIKCLMRRRRRSKEGTNCNQQECDTTDTHLSVAVPRPFVVPTHNTNSSAHLYILTHQSPNTEDHFTSAPRASTRPSSTTMTSNKTGKGVLTNLIATVYEFKRLVPTLKTT